MLKISIILPVYNTKRYLEKCLNSILNQTLKEIEVIVVNDGSTDDSQKIIDKYAKIDNRIKSFQKENGGLSDARNYGMERAKGKYIWFVDSDDFIIKEDSCEKLYNFAEKNNLDITISNYVKETKNDNIIIMKKSDSLVNRLYDGKTYLKESYKTGWRDKVVWINLYKRSFLKKYDFKFEKGRVFEDVMWTPFVTSKAKRVMCIDDYFYFYRYNSESITKTKLTEKKLEDKLYGAKVLKSLSEEQEDNELKKLLYDDVARMYLYVFYMSIKFKIDRKKYEDELSKSNIECSKRMEYGLTLYKKSNIIYYYFYTFFQFVKRNFSRK